MHITKALLIVLFLPAIFIHSQEPEKGKVHYIVCVGFYNVENLFDTLDAPDKNDEEFTPRSEKRWDTEKYRKKLENLARVIGEMGMDVSPDGPALLGLAEVENRLVLEDLVNMPVLSIRRYRAVHYESPDYRGIDVALLYNPAYFRVYASKSYPLYMESDTGFATRDQLLVSGVLVSDTVHVIVNHWPSRRGGRKGSEPKRIAAAKLGRHIADSLISANPGARIIYMGDFNDDPVNASVKKHLLSTGKQTGATGRIFFNPMDALYKKGIGSLAWNDTWNIFDQILLTPSLANSVSTSLRYHSARVYNGDYLRQSEGRYQGYPFRTFVGSAFMGGYSDHFPVYVFLVKEKM